MSNRTELRGDIEALFTTSEHSYDGDGCWNNAYLRVRLAKDPRWLHYERRATLTGMVSVALRDLEESGMIVYVGFGGAGGRLYRLSESV